ncbi:MAG: DNA replication/repair protein RecF [Streptosporangiaceae bacterium]
MRVSQVSLRDFRSYSHAEVSLDPGATVFVGANGEGKTNLLEAVTYAATLGSHRVATDMPLVRRGTDRAVLRVGVRDGDRETLVEIEINPGRANRARLGRAPVPRPRDVLGTLRVVLFSPDDIALVKGDPGERRRYLDDLLVARAPRYAGVRGDYERVLKQRSTLLKSAPAAGRRGDVDSTLDVWDTHLARAGAVLLAGRLALVSELGPLVQKGYDALAGGGSTSLDYVSSLGEDVPLHPDMEHLRGALTEALARARRAELERGVCLVGPHRDELLLRLGELPARGYASQGESWSYALSLRLAAYELLRADGGDPVLLLDDVFSELDVARRRRLADVVAPCEQVLVTAAVSDDVPEILTGARYDVGEGEVRRVDA